MKTSFEKWVENQNFSVDANTLFEEAVICYKVSAYRASFIMTYLGIQTILRDRVLNNQNTPDNIPENMWEGILNDLRNEDTWDQTVFSLVIRKRPGKPFLITDDIRNQYTYFKNRRNDCAHAKSNTISHPQVELLWLFIESNLNKFIVNGGKNGLIERIKKHYDTRITPPNSDPLPLINEIPSTMTIDEIPLFLEEVNIFFEDTKVEGRVFSEESESYQFWKYLASSENSTLKDAFISFIKSDSEIFKKFIIVYPELLYLISADEEFTRVFWTTHLLGLLKNKESKGWDLLKTLLDNEIIPESELGSFYDRLYDETKNTPPEFMVSYLKESNYFQELKKEHFESRIISNAYGITYANDNWDIIDFYLSHIELDRDIVSELNSAYIVSSYGTFYDGMTNKFENNLNFKEAYIKIVEDEGFELPTILVDEDEI